MFEKYIKIKNGQYENHLRINVDYTLGGSNWYSGGTITRGYYLYVSPVSISSREYDGKTYELVSETLGKGLKMLLKPVTRKSKKALEEATVLAQEKMKQLVDAVCQKYGYELEEENS